MFLCTLFNITPHLQIKQVEADPITIDVYPGDSIQSEINKANPGDTIFVHNGLYEEALKIDVEGLSLEGEDKNETIIDADFLQNTIEVTALNVFIRNFTIRYASENGVFIENVNNLVLENCNIENNGMFGVYLSASDVMQTTNLNLISKCEIFENYYSGIRIDGISHAENNTIVNCEFYDNGYGSMQDDKKAAISIFSLSGMIANTTIRDCLFCCSFDYDLYIDGNTVKDTNIFRNNFVTDSDLIIHHVFDTGYNWYNNTLNQGNYWIDYTQKYPDATALNGVWNTPYDVYGGDNQDLYPLIEPVVLQEPIAIVNGPYGAEVGDMITFDASGSYDPDGTYLFYDWDLGNGQILHEKTVSYAYSSVGTYTVTLTVEDYHGLTDSNTTVAVITEPSGGSGGGGGGSGGGVLPPENNPPTANANGPYNGTIGVPVLFNGSYSTDDGQITNYTWDFDDTTYGYGISTTHTYQQIGVYNCKLTVTDNNSVTDTDSFKVFVTLPNNPPTIPLIDGPKIGQKNIEYNFTVFSTDQDNDTIQYVFNWGDDQTNETDFVANGTIYTEKHTWTSSGIYNIKVYAIDSNYAISSTAETTILIDSIYCKNIGYLIDEDSNGIYDLFYSNQTGIETGTERLKNGAYLLNNDMDADWDYSYNTQTGTLSAYSSGDSTDETIADHTLFYVLALVVIIVLLLLFLMFRKIPKEEKKIEKDEEQNQEKVIEQPKKEVTEKKQTTTQKKKSTSKKKGK